MLRYQRSLFLLTILCQIFFVTVSAAENSHQPPLSDRAISVFTSIRPAIDKELRSRGFQPGSPIFIRIFKLEKNLELWIKKNNRFEKFKNYTICYYSGYLGPKLREGDRQSPEGFYSVASKDMNPWSENHLSFNIGYPNDYDRHLKRTGSAIMIHGGCRSVGCFAMTDYRIDEIYYLAHMALKNGQESFGVHIFPFAMTRRNLNRYTNSRWISFWRNLKKGYDHFERYNRLPVIRSAQGKYIISGGVDVALNSRTNIR